MPWLIAYDIESDRLRNKTAAQLLAAGCYRLQLSVFAGDLDDTVFKHLDAWLRKNVGNSKNPGDKVLILDIGPDQLRNTKWIGSAPDDWEMLTEPPDVLFI
jgi:CRISPR-associated endonuclease Cas2